MSRVRYLDSPQRLHLKFVVIAMNMKRALALMDKA